MILCDLFNGKEEVKLYEAHFTSLNRTNTSVFFNTHHCRHV